MAKFLFDATYSDTVEADTMGEARAIFMQRMDEDVTQAVVKANDIEQVFYIDCVGIEPDEDDGEDDEDDGVPF